MPTPPLSPHEVRLGTFARITALVYAAAGLVFALLPALLPSLFAQARALPLRPLLSLLHALSVSLFATLALSSALAGAAPRERRVLFAPILLGLAVACALCSVGALWSAPDSGARAPLAVTAVGTFALLLATLWLLHSASPGVNLSMQPVARAEETEQKKPVQLGLAKAVAVKPDAPIEAAPALKKPANE